MSVVGAFDKKAQERSDEVTSAIMSTVLRATSESMRSERPAAVVAAAPAGGGKTYFVVSTAKRMYDLGYRVMICTPTNKQCDELLERLVLAGVPTTFLHAKRREVDLDHVPDVDDFLFQATKIDHIEPDTVIVSTVSKMADAETRHGFPDDMLPDLLVIDEAYQVKSSEYLRVADLALSHLLVGDPGQLEPFTSLGDPDRWHGSKNHPVRDAVSALLAHHPETPVFRFPVTRRLDGRGAELARPFYAAQGHDFQAVNPAGSRTESISKRNPVIDSAIDRGWTYLRLEDGHTQEAVAEEIAGIVSFVLDDRAPLIMDDGAGPHRLQPGRVLVGVSSNEERLLVEKALDAAGVPLHFPDGVSVLTANKAQGLEFDVTVAWHPLLGADSLDEFRLATGRLCVLLTRHRHLCIVVGEESDEALFVDGPPPTPAYPGERDRVLEGWLAHEELMDVLLQNTVRQSHTC